MKHPSFAKSKMSLFSQEYIPKAVMTFAIISGYSTLNEWTITVSNSNNVSLEL